MRFVVAIDGTSASGKSTTARNVAQRLGWFFLDTGAMYRAVAYEVLRRGVDPNDFERVAEVAKEIDIDVKPGPDGQITYVNGEDVSAYLRTPEVDKAVTPVSQNPEVRKKLVAIQRMVGKNRELVCEGRDMTTVVFPDAELKIYMDADINVRAERRKKDLEKKGIHMPLEEIKKDLMRRDLADSNRDISPLKKADDAILLDTTNLTIEDEVNFVLERIKKRLKK
ncbi:(d)CMP kinase [candidate division WOR-3 bacterium]|nr:(d)CMP kinase [candidate division WOR-3 bacterium]